MKAVVAASQHWLDGDTVRKCLVELPISSTVVVSNRTGGDNLVAKIAEEEMALHVEKIEVEEETFKKKMIEMIDEEDIDSAYFFCLDPREPEHVISRHARSHRIPTQVIIHPTAGG